MNTRQAIQPSSTPPVLNLSFSASRDRFIAGLSDGLRVFRTDNCLTTYQPTIPNDGGIAIAEALDDRYIAFVGGGRAPASSPNVVVFWDCILDIEVKRFDLFEPILALRISTKYMVVVLLGRTIVFEYGELGPQQEATPPPEDDTSTDTLTAGRGEITQGPNHVKALYSTSSNPFALACLRNDTLILPAQSTGQVQIIPLRGGSKRVLRAHNGGLRSMTLSPDGTVLATASEQGTLIRVFDTNALDQLAEFRRGVDPAIIFSLAISDTNRWLACTSDKGTIHIFDLRPTPIAPTAPAPQQHRRPHPTPNRLSAGESPQSLLSGRSSPSGTPTYQNASVQEYYGLRPPPLSNPPHSAPLGPSAALAAFKSSPLAPRIMKDVRSVASAQFHMGDEPSHWQGGAGHSWTTTPDGTRKRVRHAVPGLPGEPSGRARKGVVAFAPRGQEEGEGPRLWVVGGGSDARWEVFDLVGVEGDRFVLVRGGWRRFLTRQFVD